MAVSDAALYFRVYSSAPLTAVAFEAGERRSWETIVAKRKPDQRIWIDARIPYAAYYQLFFLKCDPLTAAREGLEHWGTVYFAPGMLAPEESIRSGDWVLEPADPRLDPASGHPWLDAREAARAGEAWVSVRQEK